MVQQTLPLARLVLADATEATERLRERLASGGNYRIDWVATVALLRMVGHVLHKVNEQANPDVERVLEEAWGDWNDRTRPEHAIFREFIDPERNTVLKQYEIGRYAPSYLLTEDGHRLMLEDGSGFLLQEQPDLDRVDAALAWWETQLTAIESIVAADTQTRSP